MTWKIEFVKSAEKEFSKLPRNTQLSIRNYLRTKVSVSPRNHGKPLKSVSSLKLWRYRVNDYKLVCEIKDNIVTVLILRIDKRDSIYKGK